MVHFDAPMVTQMHPIKKSQTKAQCESLGRQYLSLNLNQESAVCLSNWQSILKF